VYRYEIINYLIEQSGYRTYLEIGIDNPNVWEDFHANRKELLNLVSVKDFRDKYKRS